MKKIITGFMGIAATLAVVGGVAYAVTFGHVEATASASTTNDLFISTDNVNYFGTVDLSGSAFSNLTTIGNSKVLFFENETSLATTGLSIQQVGVMSGDISPNNIQVAFADGNASTPTTSWLNLTDWGTLQNIGGIVIPANSAGHMVTMFVRLNPATPSNGTTSYSLTNIDFDFGPLY